MLLLPAHLILDFGKNNNRWYRILLVFLSEISLPVIML